MIFAYSIKVKQMKDILSKISFFKNFSESELDELAKISIHKSYDKDEMLFMEGENSKYLHLLIKGNVKIYKTNAKGGELFMHKLTPINFIAELANFENIPFPASARFLNSGEVIKIDFYELKSKFLTKPDFVLALLQGLSQKLIYLSDLVHNEMILSAEAKLAKLICEQNELFKNIKHNQLASFINLAPETFSRILAKFKNDGLIEINADKSIKINNLEYLKSLYEG